MAETIRLQEWTKRRIEEIVEEENHSSYDSAVKSLLKDRQLAQILLSDTEAANLSDPSEEPLMTMNNLPIPQLKGGINLVMGDKGTGKTHTASQIVRERLDDDEDLQVILASSTGAFKDTVDKIGGGSIIEGFGGTLNPLRIEVPSEGKMEHLNPNPNLFDMKLREVREFLMSFLQLEDVSAEHNEATLSRAIAVAYKEEGITHDPATHSNTSPTISDLIEVLNRMSTEPEEFANTSSESEITALEEGTRDLLIALQPLQDTPEFNTFDGLTEAAFVTGQITLFDFSKDDIVETSRSGSDLALQGSRSSSGLTLRALLLQAQEVAKHRDGKTMLVVDDLETLASASRALGSFARAARQFRHFDLETWMIWQSPKTIYEQGRGDDLIRNANHVYLHRLGHMDTETAEHLGLSRKERQYVRNAKSGYTKAESEVLVRESAHEWVPYRVVPLESPA